MGRRQMGGVIEWKQLKKPTKIMWGEEQILP